MTSKPDSDVLSAATTCHRVAALARLDDSKVTPITTRPNPEYDNQEEH